MGIQSNDSHDKTKRKKGKGKESTPPPLHARLLVLTHLPLRLLDQPHAHVLDVPADAPVPEHDAVLVEDLLGPLPAASPHLLALVGQRFGGKRRRRRVGGEDRVVVAGRTGGARVCSAEGGGGGGQLECGYWEGLLFLELSWAWGIRARC